VKKVIAIGLGVIIVVLIILIGLYAKSVYDERAGMSTDSLSSQNDDDLIDHQGDKEALLLNKYHHDSYTLDHPYIVTNPYNFAPLTALIMFRTNRPMQISITVKGVDRASDIHRSWSGYSTDHQIPVLGLYPNKLNRVIVTAKTKQGHTDKRTLFIQTKPLPANFLKTRVVTKKPQKIGSGLIFLTFNDKYAYAVDAHGDVRWYSSISNEHVFTRLKDGHIVFATKKMNQYNDLLEMDLLGKVYNAYTINGDHDIGSNDAIELPNGNLLLTLYDDSKHIEEDLIEINRQTGHIVRTIDMKKVLPKAFYKNDVGSQSSEQGVDEDHQNAIWYDNQDHSVFISNDHQDSILKMSYPDEKIKWILSDPKGWPTSYKDKLLTPVGSHFKFPAGQNLIMKMSDPDHTKQTFNVLMVDDDKNIMHGNMNSSQILSRGTQYRINEKNKTVTEVGADGTELGQTFFSSTSRNIEGLPQTGNHFIISDYTKSEERGTMSIVEVTDSASAQVVLELEITGSQATSDQQIDHVTYLSLYPKKWHFTLERHHN